MDKSSLSRLGWNVKVCACRARLPLEAHNPCNHSEMEREPFRRAADAPKVTHVDVEQALNPVAGMTADLSEQLLRAIASALDIRQVFPQVSAIAREMLPHDRLTMTLHDGQQTCIAHAVSNDDGPLLVRVSGARIADMVEGSSRIIDDLALDTPEATFEQPDYREKVKAAGYRSVLSVALAAGEQRFGLHFWSKRVRAFDATMVPVARH